MGRSRNKRITHTIKKLIIEDLAPLLRELEFSQRWDVVSEPTSPIFTSLSNFIDEMKGLGEGDPIDFKADCILGLKRKYDCKKVYMIGDKEEDMIAAYKAQVIAVLFRPRGSTKKNKYTNYIISNYNEFSKFL